MGSLGVFEHPFFCKVEKIEGWTLLETLKHLRKKSYKGEIAYTKNFWSRERLEPTFFCLVNLKQSSEAEESTLVWQLVEASL